VNAGLFGQRRGGGVRVELEVIGLEDGIVLLLLHGPLSKGELAGIDFELVEVGEGADNQHGEPELGCLLIQGLGLRHLNKSDSLQLPSRCKEGFGSLFLSVS